MIKNTVSNRKQIKAAHDSIKNIPTYYLKSVCYLYALQINLRVYRWNKYELLT